MSESPGGRPSGKLLRRFVELIEAELVLAGFVRRGPVFRYIDPSGNGIVLDIQRTTALDGEVAFFVNVGLLLAPYVRFFLGDRDPRLDTTSAHGIWRHRLMAEVTSANLPDHTFSLTTDKDAEHAAAIVLDWLANNLPVLKGQLDVDAMLAAAEEHRRRGELASAEQLATGRWQPGRWPDGNWNTALLRAYAHAEHGDLDAVSAAIGDLPAGASRLTGEILALAHRRAEGSA